MNRKTKIEPITDYPLLLTLFFLSGGAALIYQVVWVRTLSLIFGGSHLAVTTVLAVFMGGLALGSHYAGQRVANIHNKLRTYAFLELGIGALAVVTYLISQLYPSIYIAIVQIAPESSAFLTVIRVLFAVLVLLPLTTLMGATLPVLVEFCADKPELFGRRLSTLYGINTIGAVSGVLIAGFFLLPTTSIQFTFAVGIGINILVGIVALLLSRKSPPSSFSILSDSSLTSEATLPPAESTGIDPGLVRLALISAAVSGACALAYEVLWTRVLVIGLGATDYGFSSMLAAFLVGIGFGSAFYSRWIKSAKTTALFIHRRFLLLGVIQILIGVTVLVAVFSLYDLPGFYASLRSALEQMGMDTFTARQFANLIVAFTFLGAPTFLMGVAFPIVGEITAKYRQSAGKAIGEVAAINTIGAIFGAALSGYLLIYALGIERSLHLIILTNITLGAVLIVRVLWNKPVINWSVPASATMIATLLVLNSSFGRVWDEHFFAVYRSNSPEAFANRDNIQAALDRYEVLYYGEGSSSIVAATELNGIKVFSTNGRVEATTGLQDMQNQYALGHLPMMLHPNPKDVLVVGGGAGMTLGATSVYPTLESLTLAELEPKVLGVIDAFKDYNHDVLRNPKFRVVLNDGRNFLLTTKHRYDVITADPIHPWFRGAGYLYTAEYFQLAASRMNEGGVMAQWLPLYQMNTDHIRSVLASFRTGFKYAYLWLVYADAVLIGSNSALTFDEARVMALKNSPEIERDLQLSMMGGSIDSLLAYFLSGPEGVNQLKDGAHLNTDNNLYLEFDTPRTIGQYTEAPNIDMLSSVRESLLKYADLSDDTSARWAKYEEQLIPNAMDRAQVLLQDRQAKGEEMNRIAEGMDVRAPELGRWKTLEMIYRRDIGQ